MYERMNGLMLEMNMLMVQWEVAIGGTPSQGALQPPKEMFKEMVRKFGAITNQYQTHYHQATSEPKQISPTITTVQQFPHSCAPSAAQSADVKMKNLDLDRDCIVAVVEFKRQRMKRYACAQFVEPGQYVIVDGDRGQDCGFVVYCSVRNPDGSIGKTSSIENNRLDISKIKAEPGIIRGLASESDIALLHGELATNERLALKTCRQLVEQLELPMKVVDCEYQFDRRKISFYFESSRSIDFRPLTTELYRIFGVRIWLENQNNKVKNVIPENC